ncbi:hypothetical protein ACWDE9_28845, partial [Streptomyces olivaceoviridis]
MLAAAVALVDREGLAALTMRRLAADLGVEPMALHRYTDGRVEPFGPLCHHPPAAGRVVGVLEVLEGVGADPPSSSRVTTTSNVTSTTPRPAEVASVQLSKVAYTVPSGRRPALGNADRRRASPRRSPR